MPKIDVAEPENIADISIINFIKTYFCVYPFFKLFNSIYANVEAKQIDKNIAS